MKKVYETPCFMEEAFEVNEFCASSCGTTVNGKYLFECTYGDGAIGCIYLETNGQPGFQESDQKLGLYHSCNETHKTNNSKDFVDGYYVPLTNVKKNKWGEMVSYDYDFDNAKSVTVWTERGGLFNNINNWHAMEQVPQEHWTTPKS